MLCVSFQKWTQESKKSKEQKTKSACCLPCISRRNMRQRIDKAATWFDPVSLHHHVTAPLGGACSCRSASWGSELTTSVQKVQEGAGAQTASSLLPRRRDGTAKQGQPRLACLPPHWPPGASFVWSKPWLIGSKVRVVDFLCLWLSVHSGRPSRKGTKKNKKAAWHYLFWLCLPWRFLSLSPGLLPLPSAPAAEYSNHGLITGCGLISSTFYSTHNVFQAAPCLLLY